MSPELELHVALASRVLKMGRDEFVEHACRLVCRSVAATGGVGGALPVRERLVNAIAAKRAKDSPGSVEGRIVAFVRSKPNVAPRDIIAHLKGVRRDAVSRAIKALVSSGALSATGSTQARRVSAS